MEDVAGLSAETLGRAYAGKRVLITGHTGFKGSWLSFWLARLGAQVTGFALPPDAQPAMFEGMRLAELLRHVEGDVRDRGAVERVMAETKPELLFHLAAQPLVRRSYREPVETFATNVMGTAHVLAALPRQCAAVVVTSDKCYLNPGDGRPLPEDAPLGGYDPYSASKAAQEMVVDSFRRSFSLRVASARAGNVIGGGDQAEDRILPDAVRALLNGRPIPVRNPRSTRPWQHVLEPLAGYLLLGARLAGDPSFARPFNFGPDGSASVSDLVEAAIGAFGAGGWEHKAEAAPAQEAKALALDSSRARSELGWAPRWDLSQAVRKSVVWYRAQATGKDLREITALQINDYLEAG